MKFKLSTLLCSLAVAQLHAATPEAAMEAAWMPGADVALNIGVSKILASELTVPALSAYIKIKAFVTREGGDFIEMVDDVFATFNAETFTLSDVMTVFVSGVSTAGNKNFQLEGSMAIQFEKPLEVESLRKWAAAIMKNVDAQDAVMESTETGARWVCDPHKVRFDLLAGGRVAYVMLEEEFNTALARVEAGTRAEESPALKALLDERPARRGAHIALSEKPVRFFCKMLYNNLRMSYGAVHENILANLNALNGVTLGVDCADSLVAEMTLVFDTPEQAEFTAGFMSSVGFGVAKFYLFNCAGAVIPVMDSFEVSTHGTTVVLKAEVVAKDLEVLTAGLEKIFRSTKQ